MRVGKGIVTLTVGITLALLWPAVAPAGPVGYSVSSYSGDDHLYRIDLSTGSAADMGLVGTGTVSGLERIGSTIYGTDGNVRELWNVTTPPGLKIGDLATPAGPTGMGRDPVTGTTYVTVVFWDGSAGHYVTDLYELDVTTGGVMPSGGTDNCSADGLAINSLGQAYAADFSYGGTLYTLDLSNGQLAAIGGVGMPSGARYAGLAFDHDDTLWGISSDGATYTVDTATGLGTFQAFVNVGGANLTGFQGLAIPEPGTLLLLGFGALTMLSRKKRWCDSVSPPKRGGIG